jgi:cysteine desulfuration protein SufE
MFSADLASAQTSSLSPSRQQRVNALLAVRHPQQRLAAIVEAARNRSPLADEMRTDAHRVQGCLVRTWFVPEMQNGRCYFRSDSDAAMLKALLAVLCDAFSGSTPDEIATENAGFLSSLGVLHQLAENRQRTLLRVEEQLRSFARTQAPGAPA